MSAFGGKADITFFGCSRSLLGVKRTSFGFLRSMLDFGPTRCWHPLGQKFEKGPLLAQVRTYHVQVVVTFPNNRNKEIIPCSSGFDFDASGRLHSHKTKIKHSRPPIRQASYRDPTFTSPATSDELMPIPTRRSSRSRYRHPRVRLTSCSS